MKRIIAILVTLVCMLLVGFAVFMGGFAVSVGTTDELAENLTWWAAMFDLMLLIIVLILLVVAIAFHVLCEDPHHAIRKVRFDETKSVEESPNERSLE